MLYNKKTVKKILLPKDMTFGIEIEAVSNKDKFSRIFLLISSFLKEIQVLGWKIKPERSIKPEEGKRDFMQGIECVSPILRSGDENQIYSTCFIMNKIGLSTNRYCGGHIHIGADYLKDINSWKAFIKLYTKSEDLLKYIFNDVGQRPREVIDQYAKSFTKALEKAVKSGYIDLENAKNMVDYIVQIQLSQGELGARFFSVNFLNIIKEGFNTIELRLPNGTLDPNVWIDNINLFGKILEIAGKVGKINNKKGVLGLSSDEKIFYDRYLNFVDMSDSKTDDDNEKRFETFMDLLFDSEEQKEIYRNRYQKNYVSREMDSDDER